VLPGVVVVITPLIAIMKDQVDYLQSLGIKAEVMGRVGERGKEKEREWGREERRRRERRERRREERRNRQNGIMKAHVDYLQILRIKE
jgi:hypothetical protein